MDLTLRHVKPNIIPLSQLALYHNIKEAEEDPHMEFLLQAETTLQVNWPE